jgi:hypothetical protein
MATQGPNVAKVVPAQLSFLTVYNPAFGNTDETAHEQIFFYFSRDSQDAQKDEDAVTGKSDTAAGAIDTEEEQNKRLRQVGLARGMVEFAK